MFFFSPDKKISTHYLHAPLFCACNGMCPFKLDTSDQNWDWGKILWLEKAGGKLFGGKDIVGGRGRETPTFNMLMPEQLKRNW